MRSTRIPMGINDLYDNINDASADAMGQSPLSDADVKAAVGSLANGIHGQEHGHAQCFDPEARHLHLDRIL